MITKLRYFKEYCHCSKPETGMFTKPYTYDLK